MLDRGVIFGLLMASLAQAEVSFNRDIRPILSDKCFACHGPDAVARKIKLRLDSETASRVDLGGRFAVVPGDSAKSELIKRVSATSPAMRMPPAHTGPALSERQISALKAWIDEGASWQKHWAFLAPKRQALPAVKRTDWAKNAIDAFVLDRLEREGVTPAPAASKTALLRRVTLDLTGLPPTPEEVDQFLSDTSSDAYEKVVDRLLRSPRYGEKLAVRWLDAARYADTNGYQTDAERHMWRWRDWVIESFNRNLPYDQFAVQQIAGEQLPNATLDQKIATGFNRNHRGNSEGGIVPEEYLAEYAVDRVETFSTVFLGLTVGCARCHNHKYDPITQREFYQLFAYFNNIPELGRYLKYGNTPPLIKAPLPEQQERIKTLDAAVTQSQRALAEMEPQVARAQKTWEKSLNAKDDWAPRKSLVAQVPLTALQGSTFFDAGDKGSFGFYDRFTVSAWIRSEAPNGAIITRAEDDSDGEGWGLYLVDGKLQANLIKRRLDDSIRVESKTSVPAGGWRHVAMSYDGSRIANGVKLYLDGALLETELLVDAINQDFKTTQPLRIGGGGGPELRFKGEIRDARVYGREVPGDEIQVIATARKLGEIASASSRNRTEERKLRAAFLDGPAPDDVREANLAVEKANEARSAYLDGIATVMVMQEMSPPKQTHILLRGAYDKPGEKVSRGVPEALHPLAAGASQDRLGLARWVVDPANPLTARVAVNRFWQSLFGVGIVKTVEDFGAQGEWPSHPELLDWLATEFVQSGWDVKALHKTIVMSATYRQSSRTDAAALARDPENRLLARGPRVRLPAEVVRDAALSASGLLVEKQGGPSVKPYQPDGLWSELGGEDYQRDKGEGLYRRSVYTFWKRTAPPPFLSNFDSALRESCTVREGRTNTPLQALNLMNDVTFVEAARVLAQRTLSLPANQRVENAFRRVLSRRPDQGELTKLTQALAYYRDYYATRPKDAESFLAQGDSPIDKRATPSELAAYTAVASLIFNLDEAITKE